MFPRSIALRVLRLLRAKLNAIHPSRPSQHISMIINIYIYIHMSMFALTQGSAGGPGLDVPTPEGAKDKLLQEIAGPAPNNATGSNP